MTNKEKARELQLDYVENGCGDSTDIRCACEEMAEWKDQQFKEYLVKKRASLPVGFTAPLHAKLINEIINELFKED